jgi:hypothetical protein
MVEPRTATSVGFAVVIAGSAELGARMKRHASSQRRIVPIGGCEFSSGWELCLFNQALDGDEP